MSVNTDNPYLDYSAIFGDNHLYDYSIHKPTIKVLDFSDTVSPTHEDKLVIDNNNIVLTGDTPVIEKKPLSVYFRSDWKEYVNEVDTNAVVENFPWEVRFCATWDELGTVLKEEPHQLVFHINMVTNAGVTLHEFITMIETLVKLVCPNKTIPIAVGVEPCTPVTLIKELQKANVHGIVPSAIGFGVYETKQGVDALFNRIPYWPKHIIQQLPGATKTVTKNTITLTARQSEIAELISSRGLSNKRIANALNIAESTVKIHVSAILKAYGVRTRTQLAVVANK